MGPVIEVLNFILVEHARQGVLRIDVFAYFSNTDRNDLDVVRSVVLLVRFTRVLVGRRCSVSEENHDLLSRSVFISKDRIFPNIEERCSDGGVHVGNSFRLLVDFTFDEATERFF